MSQAVLGNLQESHEHVSPPHTVRTGCASYVEQYQSMPVEQQGEEKPSHCNQSRARRYWAGEIESWRQFIVNMKRLLNCTSGINVLRLSRCACVIQSKIVTRNQKCPIGQELLRTELAISSCRRYGCSVRDIPTRAG